MKTEREAHLRQWAYDVTESGRAIAECFAEIDRLRAAIEDALQVLDDYSSNPWANALFNSLSEELPREDNTTAGDVEGHK